MTRPKNAHDALLAAAHATIKAYHRGGWDTAMRDLEAALIAYEGYLASRPINLSVIHGGTQP